MKSRSRRRPTSLVETTAELALAAPQVVGHRLHRMARAGPLWSPADRDEFMGMVAEKPLAFMQAWSAMAGAWWRLQAQWALTGWQMMAAWPSPARSWGLARQAGLQAPTALASVLHQGLKPVHRKAVANARRLRRRG